MKTSYIKIIQRHIARAKERTPNWQPRNFPNRHKIREYVLERMFGVHLLEIGTVDYSPSGTSP
jgi:hypothetical protein